MKPHEVAKQYAHDVVDGRILACKWVRLACQRHLDDLKRNDDDWPFYFDPDKANRVVDFVELLPHTKGKWAAQKQLLKLEPWQKFNTCVIFGWQRKDTHTRRFRNAYIAVPRKNGKSPWAAGLGVYMLCADGEHGAEVYSGATTEKQAWEVFRPARLMVSKREDLQQALDIHVGAKNLAILSNGSRMEPVIGNPGDGSSPSMAIIDEYHEHQSDRMYETMTTGMGAREQPLCLVITTAGEDVSGPCYALQEDVQKILEGSVESLDADEHFGIVYTVDDGDDWTTEEALKKANPNYGVSVGESYLRSQIAGALRSSRKQGAVKTKHLNIWVRARSAWMNMEAWNRSKDDDLLHDDLALLPGWVGLDLGSKIDLTSAVKVFLQDRDGEAHYLVRSRHYLPERQLEDPKNRHYQGWAHDGHLTITPGSIIDYAQIEDDVLEDWEEYTLGEVAYDPWGATQLAQRLQDEHDLTVIEVPQQVAHLSEPMKWLEALVLAGRVHHDGDPVLTWAMSNVTAKVDAKDNIYPRKERDENKIDPVIALIMAIARAKAAEVEDVSSVYEERGILTI